MKGRITRSYCYLDGKVVDLWFYDCPVLWKEILNEKSIKEVKFALKSIKI